MKKYKNKSSRNKKEKPHKISLSSKKKQKEIVVINNRRNFWQIFKFSIVGGITTAIHAGLFIFILEANIANALQANYIAFSVAFLISFLGQYHWTFKNSSGSHWSSQLWKFMIVALVGLALNTTAVYIIVDILLLPYFYAVLFMTTVVPVTTFLINKKWAFS